MSTDLADGIQQMGSSAVASWATAQAPSTGNVYTDFVLLFVQLVGLCTCGNGLLKIMRYVHPTPHPKAPATLMLPLTQIVLGMFAMVPTAVYAFVTDLMTRFGWM